MTKLAKRIFHSPLLRDDLSACCTRMHVDSKLIKRSVPTRWNSIAEMIESALHLRSALDRLVEMDWHNTVAKTCLQKLKILQKEWEILSQLTVIFSVYYFITFILLFVVTFLPSLSYCCIQKTCQNTNKHKISTETCEDCISRNTCSNLLIFFATNLLRSSAGPVTLFSCYFFTFPVVTNSASKSISHSLCSQLLKI